MRSILLILMIWVFTFPLVSAQEVAINEDAAVERIMNKYTSLNKNQPYIQGWRVQILSTVDRQQFESVRSTFKSLYPYIATSWVHNRPYYKLRAGAFSNKLDALRLQYLLRSDYPSAYPAVDNEIRPEEVIGNGQ